MICILISMSFLIVAQSFSMQSRPPLMIAFQRDEVEQIVLEAEAALPRECRKWYTISKQLGEDLHGQSIMLHKNIVAFVQALSSAEYDLATKQKNLRTPRGLEYLVDLRYYPNASWSLYQDDRPLKAITRAILSKCPEALEEYNFLVKHGITNTKEYEDDPQKYEQQYKEKSEKKVKKRRKTKKRK